MLNSTRNKFRWSIILPWIELIFTTIIGVIFYFPLQRKDLADIAWILGLFFTFNNIATNRSLKDEFETIHKLSEIIDISQSCNIQEINKILHLYIAIKEFEFTSLKDDIIQKCITQLSSLSHDKTTVASGGEYHVWLLNMLRLCTRNEQVLAISVMAEAAWTELPAEKGYLDENVKAAKRGVKIDRIFVSSKDRLRVKKNREVISQHINHSKQGLVAYIVLLEELIIHDPTLLREIGEGFVLFSNRVALIDTSVPPNEVQGTVTMSLEQLKRCQHLFERLKLYARVANADYFNKLDKEVDIY